MNSFVSANAFVGIFLAKFAKTPRFSFSSSKAEFSLLRSFANLARNPYNSLKNLLSSLRLLKLRVLSAILTFFLILSISPILSASDLRDHLLVVYNKNAAESESLAREYAQLRKIPAARVVGLECSESEEISRADFDSTLLQPLQKLLKDRDWLQQIEERIDQNGQRLTIRRAIRNEIWAMVLMRGIPLKIAPDPSLVETPPLQEALRTNAASVDSELALLPFSGLPRSGLILNPYYTEGRTHRFDRIDALDSILVGRLDGPEASDVRRMMGDSVWAETHGLVGRAMIDVRGIADSKDPYYRGDEWIRQSKIALEQRGWFADLEESEALFRNNLPWSQVAWYLGWYSEHATGPFLMQPAFSRGAIAYHIHSFSASTVRSTTQHWIGPLIRAGAAATMGCVYEPYLDLTPHVDLFTQALLDGYTLIEAGYRSQRALSWMNVIVGDPLYTPFARTLPVELADAKKSNTPALPWLRMRDHLLPQDGKIEGRLLPLLEDPQADAIELEMAGDWWMRQPSAFAQASKAYDLAAARAGIPVDRIRIGLKAARADSIRGKWAAAFQLLQTLAHDLPKEFVRWGGPETVSWIAARPEAPRIPPALRPYLEKKESW